MSHKTLDGSVDQIVLPGQAAAPAGPVDVTGMYVMHHAFRRDLGNFAAAVPATPIDDRVTWRALAARWTRFAEILHKHHRAEDAGLWPLLVRRARMAGDDAALVTLEAMEAEHAVIDPILRACATGFDQLGQTANLHAQAALKERIVEARDHLAAHLAHEERDAMALVQRYLTQTDWARAEKEHFGREHKPSDIPFTAPWALHQLPMEHLARVRDAMAGRPLEIAWRLFWRRPFEQRERVAFRYLRV